MLFFVYGGHVYGSTSTFVYPKAATLLPPVCQHGSLVSEVRLQITQRSLILDNEVRVCPACYDWVKSRKAGHGQEAETCCGSHP